MQVIIIVVSFIIGTFIGYAVLLRLPALEKNNRKIKINLTLHNAVAYMYAMRRGGAQMMTIFRSLSDRANIYGEVALEFRQIVRDADFFGYDVVSAIRHLSETTPSEKLKDFLEDLLSVIESGGDMAEFLSMRVRLYQEEARFEQRQFLKVLSLVAESYVTLFVAGPLFLIIIMVVMGMMGGSAVLQLALVTYVVMPIGSVVFILLIDLISIKAEKTERYVRTKWLHTYSDVTIVKKADEESLFEQLKKYDQLRNFVYHLKHPLESFISNVNHTLYVTVPIAIIYVIIVLMSAPHYTDIETYINVVDDHIVIALLIILIPYAIFYEIWARKVLGIQALIPDFLERMAGINQVGLTIAQAIAIMVNTNLGLLSYEIRRIKRDMEWGANFTEALMRFEERVSTPSIARTVTLITKASEMSGHDCRSAFDRIQRCQDDRNPEKRASGRDVHLHGDCLPLILRLPLCRGSTDNAVPPGAWQYLYQGASDERGTLRYRLDPDRHLQPAAVPCMPCPGDLLRAYRRADGGVLSCSGGKTLLHPPDHCPDCLQLRPRCPTRLIR